MAKRRRDPGSTLHVVRPGEAGGPPRPPCPACGGALTPAGRCGACAWWLLVGPDPRRPCPEHGTLTVTVEGWCDPPPGRGVWHVAGPALVRLAPGSSWDGCGLWLEGPMPEPVPRDEALRRVRQWLGPIGRPVAQPLTAADREARQAALAAQAATLLPAHEAPRDRLALTEAEWASLLTLGAGRR